MNEGGNYCINLQFFYRKLIQFLGIFFSDFCSEKYYQDIEMISVLMVMESNILNDKRDVFKLFFKFLVLIVVVDRGIVFFWNMEYDDVVIKIDNYELFVCQDVIENKEQLIKWKKIGIVKVFFFFMVCILIQFFFGSKYFFFVCVVDE